MKLVLIPFPLKKENCLCCLALSAGDLLLPWRCRKEVQIFSHERVQPCATDELIVIMLPCRVGRGWPVDVVSLFAEKKLQVIYSLFRCVIGFAVFGLNCGGDVRFSLLPHTPCKGKMWFHSVRCNSEQLDFLVDLFVGHKGILFAVVFAGTLVRNELQLRCFSRIFVIH